LVDAAQMRDALAATAALYDTRAGRIWRSLQDTTNDPIVNGRGSLAWMTWQRAEDYYSEGELIWLDADTKIRELSGERRSLDDFARGFFGVQNGRHVPLTYTFADVVAALNAVQPYGWAAFLRARLDGHGPGAPLDGVTRAGWKLVYGEQETAFFRDSEEYRKASNFSYSLGFALAPDGRLTSVAWDSPAFKAGLTQGYTLLAVNGRAAEDARSIQDGAHRLPRGAEIPAFGAHRGHAGSAGGDLRAAVKTRLPMRYHARHEQEHSDQ
jgi:predicted metalloprotease with PDZ domain